MSTKPAHMGRESTPHTRRFDLTDDVRAHLDRHRRSGLTVMPTVIAEWVPITFWIVGSLLTVGLVIDLLRGR